MAHYARLSSNNKVVHVFPGIDEDDTSTLPEGFSSWEDWYAVSSIPVITSVTIFLLFKNEIGRASCRERV